MTVNHPPHRSVPRWTQLTLALLLVASPWAGVVSADGDTSVSLTWRGCGISKKAFMAHCGEVYEAETGVHVRLSGGGATLGIQAARERGADFGGTCRHCLPSECDSDLRLTLVAWDALAVVANPSNPVEGITKQQLKAILRQEITNWKEVGGPDLPIVVVARKGKISGVGYMLRLLILEDPEFEFGQRALRLESSGPVEKLVERSRGAIAVTGVSSARLRDVKVLELDHHAPNAKDIASGDYPYFRPLYLAHKLGLSPEADRFRTWLLSEAGQRAVADQGAVNLETGLLLMGRFKHFGNAKPISNFNTLMERYSERFPRDAAARTE